MHACLGWCWVKSGWESVEPRGGEAGFGWRWVGGEWESVEPRGSRKTWEIRAVCKDQVREGNWLSIPSETLALQKATLYALFQPKCEMTLAGAVHKKKYIISRFCCCTPPGLSLSGQRPTTRSMHHSRRSACGWSRVTCDGNLQRRA